MCVVGSDSFGWSSPVHSCTLMYTPVHCPASFSHDGHVLCGGFSNDVVSSDVAKPGELSSLTARESIMRRLFKYVLSFVNN